MLKNIARIMKSVVRAPIQDTVAVVAARPAPLEPALVARPAAGMRVQPRDEILLGDTQFDDATLIERGSVGVVLEAPAMFLLDDEVVVDWPVVGTIVHKLDTLAHVAPVAV